MTGFDEIISTPFGVERIGGLYQFSNSDLAHQSEANVNAKFKVFALHNGIYHLTTLNHVEVVNSNFPVDVLIISGNKITTRHYEVASNAFAFLNDSGDFVPQVKLEARVIMHDKERYKITSIHDKEFMSALNLKPLDVICGEICANFLYTGNVSCMIASDCFDYGSRSPFKCWIVCSKDSAFICSKV